MSSRPKMDYLSLSLDIAVTVLADDQLVEKSRQSGQMTSAPNLNSYFPCTPFLPKAEKILRHQMRLVASIQRKIL